MSKKLNSYFSDVSCMASNFLNRYFVNVICICVYFFQDLSMVGIFFTSPHFINFIDVAPKIQIISLLIHFLDISSKTILIKFFRLDKSRGECDNLYADYIVVLRLILHLPYSLHCNVHLPLLQLLYKASQLVCLCLSLCTELINTIDISWNISHHWSMTQTSQGFRPLTQTPR